MDRALRCPSSPPTLEPPHSQRVVSRQDRIRPISRVAQLRHRSAEDLLAEPLHEQQQPQSERRASNTPQNNRSPPLPHPCSRNYSDTPQSPLYQTVIPAFHPNHYDLNNTTVCLCFPLTINTPLTRWRRRRRSIKELRARDDEMRREYARLKQIESQFRGELPPYEEARKECVNVRNDRIERPQTAAVPRMAPNQERIVGVK